MFENVGEKIQFIAKLLFWLGSLTSIILAFVFGFENQFVQYYSIGGGYNKTEFFAGPFFAFLIGGPVALYLSSIVLSGFGKLVENAEYSQSEKTDQKNKT